MCVEGIGERRNFISFTIHAFLLGVYVCMEIRHILDGIVKPCENYLIPSNSIIYIIKIHLEIKESAAPQRCSGSFYGFCFLFSWPHCFLFATLVGVCACWVDTIKNRLWKCRYGAKILLLQAKECNTVKSLAANKQNE